MAKTTEQKETPPYVSYSTLKNLIDQFRETGLPSHVDSSVLDKVSGSVRQSLLSALRFLKLITPDNSPTEDLIALADKSTDKKITLKKILERHYPLAIKHLKNGTPDSIKKNFGYEPSTAQMSQKYITFFLSAAKDAGLEISSYILNKTKVRQPKKRHGTTIKKQNEPKTNDEKEKLNPPNNDQNNNLPEGLVQMPVPIGIKKTWYINISEDYTDEEINKFVEVIKMTLVKKSLK